MAGLRCAAFPIGPMMLSSAELAEVLLAGENSGVEFKRDDNRPEQLAREMVGLANLRGGRVLLGVEDDGEVSGVVRDDVDEWVLTVAREKVRPPLIPFVEFVHDPRSGRRVLVVTVERGYAVHAVWHNNHYSYFVRAGRQTRTEPDFVEGAESLTMVLHRGAPPPP